MKDNKKKRGEKIQQDVSSWMLACRKLRTKGRNTQTYKFSPCFFFLVNSISPFDPRFFSCFTTFDVENLLDLVRMCVTFHDTNIMGTRIESRTAPAGSLCKHMLMPSRIMTNRKCKIFFQASNTEARNPVVLRFYFVQTGIKKYAVKSAYKTK